MAKKVNMADVPDTQHSDGTRTDDRIRPFVKQGASDSDPNFAGNNMMITFMTEMIALDICIKYHNLSIIE